MKIKYEIATITPKRAAELLKFNTYEGQRAIRPNHVNELVQKIKDSRFLMADLAFLKTPSKQLLMNGQHTLTSCCEAGLPIKAAIQWFEQNGESPVDIARLFAQFDGHAKRNLLDVSAVYAQQIGWGEWPRAVVRLCAASLTALHGGRFRDSNRKGGHTRLSIDQQAELLVGNKRACEFVFGIIGFGDTRKFRHMFRIPVVSAMVLTYRKSAEDAALFWTAVRDGELLRASSSEYILREFLLSSSSKETRNAERVPVPMEAVHRQCIIAWNAMRAKTQMPRKVYKNAEIPTVK